MIHSTQQNRESAPHPSEAAGYSMLRGLLDRVSLQLLLGPTMIILLLINLFPLIYQLVISLSKFRLSTGISGFAGLTHYAEAFSDQRFWNSIWVMTKFSVTALAAELAIGLVVAIILDRMHPRVRHLVLPVLVLPMVMSPVVVGYMWQFMFSQEYGIFIYLLKSVGIHVAAPPLATAETVIFALAVVDIWQWTPLVILIILGGLQALSIEIYEAAIVDGATPLQLLQYITLPLIKTELVIALLLRMLDAFKVFDIVFAMTGGGPGTSSESLSLYLYRVIFKFVKMDSGAAMAVLFLIVVTIVTKILVNMLASQREQIA